jgi:hypothetical protein
LDEEDTRGEESEESQSQEDDNPILPPLVGAATVPQFKSSKLDVMRAGAEKASAKPHDMDKWREVIRERKQNAEQTHGKKGLFRRGQISSNRNVPSKLRKPGAFLDRKAAPGLTAVRRCFFFRFVVVYYSSD